MTTTAVRKQIIDYLQRELVGPAPSFPAVQINREEILRSQDPPRLRYSAGVLFPMRSIATPPDIDEKEMGDSEAGPTEQPDTESQSVVEGDLADSPNPVDQQPETDLDMNLANQ